MIVGIFRSQGLLNDLRVSSLLRRGSKYIVAKDIGLKDHIFSGLISLIHEVSGASGLTEECNLVKRGVGSVVSKVCGWFGT